MIPADLRLGELLTRAGLLPRVRLAAALAAGFFAGAHGLPARS